MTPLTSTSSSPKRPRKPKPLSSMASRKHKRTTLIIFTLSLIAIIFFILTLTPPKLTYTSTHQIKTHQTASPVKMYMYDIPSRFTHDIIKQHSLARSGNPGKDVKYPGHQHMAEWYLFRDLMSGRGGAGRIVKVDDPEEAELFYVPVFSSLSLIVNPAGSGGYRDENMQEEFVKWLEGQVYWRRNGGWDHVIVAQDPNALGRVVDRVKNAVLLVSDFGRLRRDQASLVKDVIVPYSHRIRPFDGEVGVESRKTLLFFMGNRYRKEGGKIRDLLFQILENEDDVIIKHGAQSRESRRAASQGMHTSKFCLHPAGDTPSACRLFDAIVSMCIPVIVSDSIELPFEDVIDYRKIAVFVETANAVKPGELVRLLRAVPERKILDYQEELRKVKPYFIYDDPNGTVKEIWRQVSQKLPLIKLMINRDKRLVKRSLTESDCSCICTNKTGVITSL